MERGYVYYRIDISEDYRGLGYCTQIRVLHWLLADRGGSHFLLLTTNSRRSPHVLFTMTYACFKL